MLICMPTYLFSHLHSFLPTCRLCLGLFAFLSIVSAKISAYLPTYSATYNVLHAFLTCDLSTLTCLPISTRHGLNRCFALDFSLEYSALPLADPELQNRGGQILAEIFERFFWRSRKNFCISQKIFIYLPKFLMTFFSHRLF